MPSSEKLGNPGSYPAGSSFAALLNWHLNSGTRPTGDTGKLGRQWSRKEFADKVGATERTVGYWLKGTKPYNINQIEKLLFENNADYNAWRFELRRAYNEISNHKLSTSSADISRKNQGSVRSDENYSVVSSFVEIIIHDSKGEEATYTKTIHAISNISPLYSIRDLILVEGQDQIISCDGVTFTKSEHRPGIDKISYFDLHVPKNTGECYQYRIQRKLIGTFLGNAEYWQAKVISSNENLQIKIVFPQQRIPKGYVGRMSYGEKEEVISNQPTFVGDGNNPYLLWIIHKAIVGQFYTLDWHW